MTSPSMALWQLTSVAYVRAQQVRRAAALEMRSVLREIDLLVVPAALAGAPRGSLRPAIFGMPSLTVPVGRATEGLPLGNQFAADFFREQALLEAGLALEASLTASPLLEFSARKSSNSVW